MGKGESNFYKQTTLPGIPEKEAGPDWLISPPDQIGPYRIQGLLSKGGMSCIYLGFDPQSHDPVAIKILHPKYIEHPEVKDRFLQEAEIIGLADHPNIVKVYGHGEWEGGLYLAIEFIQGISLRQFILHNTISLKRSLEIALQIAYALLHLHSHGVIHRDLKPDNVLLTTLGEIKVIDFGIAQLRSGIGERPESSRRQLIGTPAYMAPEQQLNPETVSPAADIYSLAIILYELILGKISHGKIHLSLMPKGLQPIFEKCLAQDPKDRFQDIVSFIDALSHYLKSDSLAQDQQQRGYTRDLADHLRSAQETLLSDLPGNWNRVEIGFARHHGFAISGIYYDFLDIGQGCYGIIIGEPSSKGVEGIVHCAMLHGMTRALSKYVLEPVDLVRELNRLILTDSFEEIFTLSYLILNPVRNQLHYISCGHGPLRILHPGREEPEVITTDNIALGIDPDQRFYEVTQTWRVGDTLVLTSYWAEAPEHNGTVNKAVQEMRHAPAQKQAEAIVRAAVSVMEGPTALRPIMGLSIHRKS
jgi:eukaryotic-like serine/threonine-protein kinase